MYWKKRFLNYFSGSFLVTIFFTVFKELKKMKQIVPEIKCWEKNFSERHDLFPTKSTKILVLERINFLDYLKYLQNFFDYLKYLQNYLFFCYLAVIVRILINYEPYRWEIAITKKLQKVNLISSIMRKSCRRWDSS